MYYYLIYLSIRGVLLEEHKTLSIRELWDFVKSKDPLKFSDRLYPIFEEYLRGLECLDSNFEVGTVSFNQNARFLYNRSNRLFETDLRRTLVAEFPRYFLTMPYLASLDECL